MQTPAWRPGSEDTLTVTTKATQSTGILWMGWILAAVLMGLCACAGDPSSPDEGDNTTTNPPAAEPQDKDGEPKAADTTDNAGDDGPAKAKDPAPDVAKTPEKDPPPAPKDTHGQIRTAQPLEGIGKPLDFLEFVVSHCLVDELDITEYAVGWRKWSRRTGFRPKTGPVPNTGRHKRLPEGSQAAKKRAEALRKAWKENPRSHTVDCIIDLPRRDCELCRGKGAKRNAYIAYLPKELITAPEKVRSILLLVPGGNGGRTRYFLTPIPNKTIWDSMSGGLEVQRHTDEFLANNPGTTPPIVVALNSGGWLSINGNVEFLTHDMPTHIAQTYLGTSDLGKIAVGADGISSGSRSMMRAYAHRPKAHNTVGLTCMHCGGRKGGFQFEDDFLVLNDTNKIFDSWRQRAKDDLLHFRFAIGNRDKYWSCNLDIHQRLVKENIIKPSDPLYENCRGKEHPRNCDTTWEDFFLYDGQGHHYGLLLDSWVPSLQWHIASLHKAVLAMDGPRR